MKLVKPDLATLNIEFHERVLFRTTDKVPNYIAGDDRPAVYDTLGHRHGRAALKLDQYPEGEWMMFRIALGNKPWIGTGKTLLEALVVVQLIASGVEVER